MPKKMKPLPRHGTRSLIMHAVVWVIIMVVIIMVSIHTAHAAPNAPVSKRTHYLYQVQDGVLRGFTEHGDRQSCMDTAYKLKLKQSTWQCLPR